MRHLFQRLRGRLHGPDHTGEAHEVAAAVLDDSMDEAAHVAWWQTDDGGMVVRVRGSEQTRLMRRILDGWAASVARPWRDL